jgi:hypothetical protein
MVGMREASAVLGKDTQAFTPQPMRPGLGGSRGLHWSQAADGTPMICVESLLRLK